MRKMVKLAIVGGVVGAGAALYRSAGTVSETPAEATSTPVTPIVGGLAAGATLGFMLDRRASRRAKRTRRAAAVALATDYGRRAKPKVDAAAHVAAVKAREAAVAAQPVVRHAAEVAKHRAEEVATAAMHRAQERLAA